MMYFITFLCILLVFACIIAIAWILTDSIMKWQNKKLIKDGEKFNKEWDEKTLRFVHNSLYGDDGLSQVENVEYEDVSEQKLIKK